MTGSDNKINIAFQGAPGAFSHAAAKAFTQKLGLSAALISCQTFSEIFAKVTEGSAVYGAIPLENSSIGSIVANYDLLWENNVTVIAEYFLPVHHQLIGFPGVPIEQLQLVFSHPAALDQCRQLFRQYKNLNARVHWDTSGSVAFVKESTERTYAAIASELAASEYGMDILLPNIEDYALNTTRFGLITNPHAKTSQSLYLPALPATGQVLKLTLAVELPHEVGSLAKLLSSLAAAGANLTKIESRPVGEAPWHYRFFIDIEVDGTQSESQLQKALCSASTNYKLFGHYFAC